MNIPSSYASFDGARIALHTLGEGRPTLSPDAAGYFAKVSRDTDLNDELGENQNEKLAALIKVRTGRFR